MLYILPAYPMLIEFSPLCETAIIGPTQSLDVFAKSRKTTVGFVVSVRMEQLGSHRTDFHEI